MSRTAPSSAVEATPISRAAVDGNRDASVAASFWLRSAAWSVDASLIGVATALLTARSWLPGLARLDAAVDGIGQALPQTLQAAAEQASGVYDLLPLLLGDPRLAQATSAMSSAIWQLLLAPILMFTVLGALYHVGFECSHRRASPGKRLLGLWVESRDGRRLRPVQSLLRFGAGAVSWLTLNAGHAMAAMPPQHLALHDLLAGTRVRTRPGNRLPLWATAWLTAFIAVQVVVVMKWSFEVASRWQHALESALIG